MHIKIHTNGITGSGSTKDGEQPDALFSGLLEIDGQVYTRVNDISANFGDKFASVEVTFLPSSVEIVQHTETGWSQICQQADRQDGVREALHDGNGRVIAVYVSPEKP